MAKQSPYALSKSKGHILSQFTNRLGIPVTAHEIRLAINGWTSQALVHDCSRCVEITPEDLVEYVVDKGYALTGGPAIMDKAVTRLAGSLAKSKPLHAEYVPGYNMWRLSSAKSVLEWPAALDSLAAQIKHECTVDDGHMFRSGHNDSRLTAPPLLVHVPSWRLTKGADELLDALVGKGVVAPPDEVRDRVRRPVAWFEDKLRKAGVPMELFRYDGVIDSRDLRYGGESYVAYGIPNTYAGATRLVGPLDTLGFRPVWTGPLLGDVLLWICNEGGGYSGSCTYDFLKCRWKTYLPQAGEVGLTAAEAEALAPGAGFGQAGEKGYLRFRTGEVSAKFTHNTAKRPPYAAYPYAVPLSSILPFASGTWVGIGEVASVLQFRQTKWLIANGNGVVEWRHHATPYAKVGEAADGYGLDTWSASPTAVMFRVSMAAIRDYIALQLTRDDLTVADTAKLNRALTESEPYLDALISVTVSDISVPACSLDDVKSLEMVKQAKKGDVDLLKEDLGQGITLTTLGKRLDALRVKGRKFCTYGHVVDESVTAEQIVSVRVASTFNTAASWDLSFEANDITGPTVRGTYSAGLKEVLTPLEAALLWVRGARSSDGTLSEGVIGSSLGLGASWKEDLETLGARKLIGSGAGRSAWGDASASWDKFSAFSFCDYQSYPVVGFTEKDTLVRQQLLFKAGDSDPADLACAIFFANQLSFSTT